MVCFFFKDEIQKKKKKKKSMSITWRKLFQIWWSLDPRWNYEYNALDDWIAQEEKIYLFLLFLVSSLYLLTRCSNITMIFLMEFLSEGTFLDKIEMFRMATQIFKMEF